ncbi:MAG: hypothetical protein N3A57_00770 [Negativicutes bacterium]|nr:hypothetical protein [Negativicutes bacterium]
MGKLYIRTVALILAISLSAGCATALAAAGPAAELTMAGKLSALEKAYYGSEQAGALLERVDRLETDVYGMRGTTSLDERLTNLYTYTFVTSDSTPPSFVLKLNAVEWGVTHNISDGPLKNRLTKVYQLVVGNDTQMSLNDMLRKLSTVTFGNQSATFSAVTVPKDTLIKIEFINDANSKTSRVGDPLNFKVAEDVTINGVVAIPKGAYGRAKVSKAEPAGSFGRQGQLEASFQDVTAMDDSSVGVFLGEKAKQESTNMAYAAGASLVGLALLGPVGLIGGIFVQGDEVSIKSGQMLYLQTTKATTVYGVQPPAADGGSPPGSSPDGEIAEYHVSSDDSNNQWVNY